MGTWFKVVARSREIKLTRWDSEGISTHTPNLMINIAVSMLEMRTLTLSLLMSLTPSLKNTMVSLLVSNTHPTWMSTKLMAILTQLHPFTAPGSVLEGALKVSDFPPELLVIKDWVLKIS